MTLREYQSRSVQDLAVKMAQGKRKVVFQLATGGGKTIIFSAIAQRYVAKSGKRALILCHRKELLAQTRKTLANAYGIAATAITAGMHYIPPADVYVGMVESVNRRIPKLENIGLVIIDEAHIASFNKIHAHFPDQLIIGVTATPMSSSRKKPLKLYYDDIVCGVDIPELIAAGHLCQNVTWAPEDVVDRIELEIKNGEFEESAMALQFSRPKYISNTVKAYEKWAKDTKTMIFNCNIEHSKNVCAAFVAAGYDAKYLDSNMEDKEREEVLHWFKITAKAILCNVAIATTGFDEPSIETVMINKATMSMTLWLQMTGRGGRPTPAKSMFTIIDMGGNAITHGDWSQSRDWKDLFFNPPKPGETKGVLPVKGCPNCEAIIPAGSKVCPFCGFVLPVKAAALEEELGDFIVVTKGINVKALMAAHANKKEHYIFFKIGDDLATNAKNIVTELNDESAIFILQIYNNLARKWCKEVGKRFNKWYQNEARKHLFSKLSKQFPEWQSTLISELNLVSFPA